MLSFLWILFVVIVMVPALSLANGDAVEIVDPGPPWLPMLLSAIAALTPALISTFIKSDFWWMKIVDAFAFNWGKARNDPGSQ